MTLKGPFLSKDWIGSNPDYETSSWVMLGMPYDGTCSYRPGTRFAPEEIRLASWGLEEYSPDIDREMSEISFYDAGELDLPFGNREKILETIRENVQNALDDNKKVVGIGGEHLVTLPQVEAYLTKYPDLCVIHFDAHTDLREDYLGEKLSHASVIRRISEKLKSCENLCQVGIRSGEKYEFEFMQKYKTLCKSKEEFSKKIDTFRNKPVFITVDLDVLDPSIMSGTGTPEAGGLTYKEFIEYLKLIKGQNVVGMDIVELSPHYDASGSSTATASKVIREMMLLFA
ncbi:agmatinase [bacterium]|nr:agmatinase [bacterium]